LLGVWPLGNLFACAKRNFGNADKSKSHHGGLKGISHVVRSRGFRYCPASLGCIRARYRAVFYTYRGRYAEAEPMHKRALAIREKAGDADSSDLARSLNNLAGLYLLAGRYAEGEPLFKRSLAIRDKFGPDNPAAPMVLDNLGEAGPTLDLISELYDLQQRIADALAAGQRNSCQGNRGRRDGRVSWRQHGGT
jgi:tetratricopeptide (TPR) repeat protein